MDEKIRELKARARAAIADTASSLGELNDIRVKFLGKKGEITSLLRSMSAVAEEERPRIGKIVNEARAELEALFTEKSEELSRRALAEKIASEQIDVTLPGRTEQVGHLHPLTITLNRIKKIFLQMGFTIEEGPEIESDYYNFEARYAGLVLYHGGYSPAVADFACPGAYDAKERAKCPDSHDCAWACLSPRFI